MAPGGTGGPSPMVEHLTGPAVSPRPPVCCHHDRDQDLPSCLGSGGLRAARESLLYRRASLSAVNHQNEFFYLSDKLKGLTTSEED